MNTHPDDDNHDRWLDASAIQLLLPHRPPMVMVDSVQLYASGPPPRLEASRCFSADDPFLAGHFPGLPIVPGALIVEGLAQSAGLLRGLLMLEQQLDFDDRDCSSLREALAEIGSDKPLTKRQQLAQQALREAIDSRQRAAIGVLASTRMRFRQPVSPGERLHYSVVLSRQLDQLAHFEVRAEVAGRTAAEGSLVLGWRPRAGQTPSEP